ncbi:hypothetical protein HYV81_05750 [Candidatus Woesearchaeota archaeon]|nr:hypothetical protein [Candidatus Woesearchaeota archaeon]
MNIITEGKAKIKASIGKITAKMDVFYNPVMKLNRDISVLMLKVKGKKMKIADPLAASGVRALRFLLETRNVESIAINDSSGKAVESIIGNIKLNEKGLKKLKQKIEVYNKDANLFLLEHAGSFDYIDIDPFGNPNNFLDAAVKRIAKVGILAVTATDTSALAGTFPEACRRKYWANPLRNEEMHEIGLRILIRKVQLVAGQYEKALIPALSYATEHYYRVFFECVKGKKNVDAVLRQHGMYKGAGPLWLGRLWDRKVADAAWKEAVKADMKEAAELLGAIREEARIDAVGFHDIHALCKKHKVSRIPKQDDIIKKIKSKGYAANRTHFNGWGIRSAVPEKELLFILRNC